MLEQKFAKEEESQSKGPKSKASRKEKAITKLVTLFQFIKRDIVGRNLALTPTANGPGTEGKSQETGTSQKTEKTGRSQKTEKTGTSQKTETADAAEEAAWAAETAEAHQITAVLQLRGCSC